MEYIYAFASKGLGLDEGVRFPLALLLSEFTELQVLGRESKCGAAASPSTLGLGIFHAEQDAGLVDSDRLVSGFCPSGTLDLPASFCLAGLPQPGSLSSWTSESARLPCSFLSLAHYEQISTQLTTLSFALQ